MTSLDDFGKRFPTTRLHNLSAYYPTFVPFTVNSVYPVHKWYRFKEGFSKDLVHLLTGLSGISNPICLDPFGGSGTTALACQEVGLICHSIEVNPFLHSIAQSKLETNYTLSAYDEAVRLLGHVLKSTLNNDYPEPIMTTITENGTRKKWLFSRPVLQAILVLRASFAHLDPIYSDLMMTVLASILTEVGNTVKDGKCVRYKKKWQQQSYTRQDVYDLFLYRAHELRADIEYIQNRTWPIQNRASCTLGNSLQQIRALPDKSIDLVITSPPYLNSFDYTDVYMPELWALGFVNSYEDVRRLRKLTIRSHVQVKWKAEETERSQEVNTLIDSVIEGQLPLWNSGIPEMIRCYFIDMRTLIEQLMRILRPGGKIFIVVGTSSYYNVSINTDLLIAGLAENAGLKFDEMRVARSFTPSTQQIGKNGSELPLLRESILMFSKTDKPFVMS